MKTYAVRLLALLLMVGGVSAANAGEPQILTTGQMDRISAGGTQISVGQAENLEVATVGDVEVWVGGKKKKMKAGKKTQIALGKGKNKMGKIKAWIRVGKGKKHIGKRGMAGIYRLAREAGRNKINVGIGKGPMALRNALPAPVELDQ